MIPLGDEGKDVAYLILRLVSGKHALISIRTLITFMLRTIGLEPCRNSFAADGKCLAMRYLLFAPGNRLLSASMRQINRTRAALGCHIEIIIRIQFA